MVADDNGRLEVVDIELISLEDGNDVDISENTVAESDLLSVDAPVLTVDMTEALDMGVVLDTADMNVVSIAGTDVVVIDGSVVANDSEALEVEIMSL